MHFPPKFLQKPPPTFSTVYLLHRLYDVDAPVSCKDRDHSRTGTTAWVQPWVQPYLILYLWVQLQETAR